jgi:hypothetical protein
MNGTASSTETVEGRVVGENAKGIKLDGTGVWLNYSRYADVPHPERGQQVRVEVGNDGFIRKLQVLGCSAEVSGPTAALDRLSMRLRVLEIAASTTVGFAGCNDPGKVTSGAILPLADKLLGWVLEQPARHTIEDLEP